MRNLKSILIAALLMVAVDAQAQQVVANRGSHSAKGVEENTLAALRAAESEAIGVVLCDVNMTEDGAIVVVQGPWLGDKNDPDRLNIQRSDLATLRSKQLANGECVPTLEEYLTEVATMPTMRLIINIREHATPQAETEVVRKVVAAVKSHKLQANVEYSSSRQHVCSELVRLAPSNSVVLYYGSNLTPQYIQGLGYAGFGYSVDALKRVPRWIDEARRLGLKVDVRGVNSAEDAAWAVQQGAERIVTDNPSLIKRYIK